MSDYIVVGAGAAGCVLAGRLTEDPTTTVTLLEAGGSNKKLFVQLPAAFSKLFRTKDDWAYETEPEPELGGRRLYWPRGKMVGGSSSMNAMIYIRGAASDYDAWARAGASGWGFREVLPYFKRAERNGRGPSDFHGGDGALDVNDLRHVNEISDAFLAACRERGLPLNGDFNGEAQEGFGHYQVNQRQGRRFSAADAYLAPALARKNLRVVTGAQVTRLIFEGKRCRGVEYLRGGKVHREMADREVLLSGGAINSPQLLLASGIGPAGELRALGIPVLADRPGVGKNLQDHPMVAMSWECSKPVTLASAESLTNTARFLLGGKGPLTSNVAESGGFWKSRPGLAEADVQVIFAPAWYVDHGFVRPTGHGFSMCPILLRPESRGEIRLKSGDTLVAPQIFARYLSAGSDRKTLVDGLKMLRDVASAAALAPYRGTERSPGAALTTDEALGRYVGQALETLYHPVGTCAMGRSNDAVVDSSLKVHQIDGLRVVDASVMPTIVGGNTQAPTLMIAEHAAAILRGSTAQASAA